MAGLRKINWFPKVSAWETAQAWREKHRAMTQSFLNDSSATSGALLSAWTNLSSGMATLAAQAASKRVQAEAKAKLDELSTVDLKV